MQSILSEVSVSISELKKNPSCAQAHAAGVSVAVLDHNRVVAYLVPAELYEQVLKRIRVKNLSRWCLKTYKQ